MDDKGKNTTDSEKPVRFVLYFPLGREDDAPRGELLSAVEEYLCETFGGLTSYPATGLYVSPIGKIQREPVQVLEAFADPEAWSAAHHGMHSLAGALARLLDQDSVALSVDGSLLLKEAAECDGLPAQCSPASIANFVRGCSHLSRNLPSLT